MTSTANPPSSARPPLDPSTKRSADRNTISKKRRSTQKLVDPLDVLTLVVTGPRGNGKFVCPLCANNFGRRCELKRHVAEVHTINGARRFFCKHAACGKSFTRKDALAKHEIVKHQGKRRFSCPTCSEKFTSRYDLSRHNIRVHSNVKKRFTCQFCRAGFSQKSQLTMHKGRVHEPRTTDCHPAQPCSSMDSLAAAAAAVAAHDEMIQRLACSYGHTKATCVDDLERMRAAQEAAAATLAAEALLQAAAVLQH